MSTTRPDNPPAFPHTRVYNDSTEIAGGVWKESGMTLRDWFAGQALLSVAKPSEYLKRLATFGPGAVRWENEADESAIAFMAYAVADAMLAARQPKGTP